MATYVGGGRERVGAVPDGLGLGGGVRRIRNQIGELVRVQFGPDGFLQRCVTVPDTPTRYKDYSHVAGGFEESKLAEESRNIITQRDRDRLASARKAMREMIAKRSGVEIE